MRRVLSYAGREECDAIGGTRQHALRQEDEGVLLSDYFQSCLDGVKIDDKAAVLPSFMHTQVYMLILLLEEDMKHSLMTTRS